jgi:cholesterol oxidase
MPTGFSRDTVCPRIALDEACPTKAAIVMRRLSSPHARLGDHNHYRIIVIGSGYGGSIAAARLAAAGHQVCLLERGKEWLPGEFPDDLSHALTQFRTESNPLGLYDYDVGDDLDIFSGNGLGGTSLVNANVAIRPDREVFEHPRWPTAIQAAGKSGDLDKYFDRVTRMLKVVDSRSAAERLLKFVRHKESSKNRRGAFRSLPLAVNFSLYDGTPNHVGVPQRLCTLCGDCVTGCNVSAKNTLAMNYLPLAKNHGAEIFTQMEVRFVLPAAGGGYDIFVAYHPEREREPVEMHLRGDVIVVAAGTPGSTGILLRSRERGLPVSRRLGHHFGSNGDLLGFGYNTDSQTNILGFGDRPDWRSFPPVGPTITAVVDYRSRVSLEDRFIIEEGAIPLALVGAAGRVVAALSLAGEDTDTGLRDRARELERILRDQVRRDPNGALNHTMIYLGMGHDGADGRVVLDHKGRPKVLWGAIPDRPVFTEISREMRELVAALGGTFVRNPRWEKIFGENAMTVHPLGGCPMGADADSGVVNEAGQVFHPDRGDLHEGLFVSCGSVIPTSLGVNPFLTISAIAERIAEQIAARLGEPKAPTERKVPMPAIPKPPPGLEFTEEMKGYCTPEVTDAETPAGYEEAEKKGREHGTRLDFKLTILIDDIREFIANRKHEARAEGFVDSTLFGERRRVEEARFNLFMVDGGNKRMRYRLKFIGSDGKRYFLDGFKEIRDDLQLDVWKDNTTLFTNVREGWSLDAPVVAQGIMHVLPADFLRQLTTFRVHNAENATESVAWLRRFGAFFFGELWDTYVRHEDLADPAGTSSLPS